MDIWTKCISSPITTCVYFAIILLLLILVVYHLRSMDKNKENIIGVGLGHGGGYSGQTSGATQRQATEFTGTNQQPRQTLLTADVAEIAPNLSEVGRAVDIYKPRERLVSNRGEPDFWEIGSQLGAYKRQQAAEMAAEVAAQNAAERLTERGKIANLETDELASLLIK